MATENLSPAQWALLTVQEGWSATRGLAEFRANGGHIGNETWYRLHSEIQSNIANRAGIFNQILTRIPIAQEIRNWTTRRAQGYIQQVEVLVRDKATGQVFSVPFSLAGKTLRSRRAVLKHALSTVTGENESKYEQAVLGAVYTGTYRLTPEGA
jgi:hypothetical protein